MSLISFVYNDSGAGWFSSNVGLGPGVVKWFGVSVDDAPQRSWVAVARLLGLSGVASSVHYPNTLIPHGARPGVLFWVKPGADKDALMQNNGRVRIELCYCSLYRECWLASDKIEGLLGESCDAAKIKHPQPFSAPPPDPVKGP